MKIQKSSSSGRGLLSPILVILVSGSLCLAIIDRENRPAYFDIVKIAVGYAFGAMKLQSNVEESNKLDDSNRLQNLENSKSGK